MVTVEVQLTDEQTQVLNKIASEQGVPVAEIIQRSIKRYLVARETAPTQKLDEASLAELRRRALAMAGKYSSGASDVSENHDKHLADIYGDFLTNNMTDD
jgi:hypothetical protein